MYIPESHYQVKPSTNLPLVINVHGSLRRAEHCRDSLIDLADRTRAAILAPLFPAGINDLNDSQNYKFIRYRDVRYDLILLSMVDEVAKRWPGIETAKFHLVGFSGGGQFVSRFFLLHPHRLLSVSIGAPGTVTRLDCKLEWPRGLKGAEEIFDGLSVSASALRSVKHVQLIVGADDVLSPGGDLLRWHAEQKMVDSSDILLAEASLPARTQVLAELRNEMLTEGVQVQYDVVPGAGHESRKVLPTVIKFLEVALGEVSDTKRAYGELRHQCCSLACRSRYDGS